jgi:hypothetical protein
VSDRAIELFERYLDELQAGGRPDPAAYVADAGDEAGQLSGMIATYLTTHPRTDIPADEVLELAARPELQPPRPWSQLLPELRARTGTRRDELVRRLAELLHVQGSEPQVDGYVHELETGQLSPRRVRPAVVKALATALAAPVALLLESRALEPPAPSPTGTVFARMAAAPSLDQALLSGEPPSDPRVDDLFTGADADG